MEILLKELQQNKAVLSIQKKESVLGNLSHMEEAPLLAADYRQKPQKLLIIKSNVYITQKFCEHLQTFLGDGVPLFSLEESLCVGAVAASPESKAIQMKAMARPQQQGVFMTVLNTVTATRSLPPPEVFKNHRITLEWDQEIEYKDLEQLLFKAGYTHVSRVDQPLCYTARGGITDVYSVNYDHLLCIKFFDNIVESIHFFDIATQRAIEIVREVTITPASDLLFTDAQVAELVEQANKALKSQLSQHDIAMQKLLQEHMNGDLDFINNHMMESRFYKYYAFLKSRSTVFDYVPDTQTILSSVKEVQDSVKHMYEGMVSYPQELFQEGISLHNFDVFIGLYSSIRKHSYMEFHQFVDYKKPITSQTMTMSLGDINLERTMQEVQHQARGRRVPFYLNHKEQEQVRELLEEVSISWRNITFMGTLEPGIRSLSASLPEGFICLEEQVCVHTREELSRSVKKAACYSSKFRETEVLHDHQKLNVEGYVVYNQHGIGKCLEIVNKKIDGVRKDFLYIAYKGDDVLLVPLEQLKLIRKLVSEEGVSPRLNKLGNGGWEKAREGVSTKIVELTDCPAKLYTSKDENIGHAFVKDTSLQKQFEEDLEYELIPDQTRVVQEIKQDMESAKPMDRLLRGDADFGKTEVVVRTAFKAAVEGRQVAFLCPMTILSLQHYRTFMKRFRDFPVDIAVVNRLIRPPNQKHIIHDLKEGNADIPIGTHRLLSKDIVFRDLGLLAIDEE